MRNSRLIKLLQNLSSAELRRFVQFVSSPFFNQNEKLIRLAEYLHQTSPDFGDASLQKPVIFKVIIGDNVPYQEQIVHDHMSQLLRLFEKFLGQLNYEQDEAQHYRYLLNALHHRGQVDHFTRVLKKAEKIQNRRKLYDTEFYLNNYLLSHETAGYYGSGRKRSKQEQVYEHIATLQQDLDIFFLATKLKYICETINRKNIVNQSFQPELVPQLQDYLNSGESPYLEVPAISVYFNILMTLTKPEETSYYFKLVDILEEQSDNFSTSEAHQMYGFAQNYCIKRLNRGDTAFLKELFRLYQKLLSKDILLESGYLAHWYYKNIVTIGVRLEEFDWVLEFLESFKRKLKPEIRENAYNYNLAHYYYAQKDYKSAMILLQQIDVGDWSYHLGAKSMLMQIYYEIKDDDGIAYLTQAFKAYLKRNKDISRNYFMLYSEFIRLTRKAFHIRMNRHLWAQETFEQRLSEFENLLNENQGVANLSWLKAKLAELKESHLQYQK